MSEETNCPLPMSLGKDTHSDSEVKEILKLRNVGVVGISRETKCYKGLLDVNEPIDVVDVFRPSADVPAVVEQAIKKKPKVIWLQEGIHNQDAEEEAKRHGIDVVWNRCMMKEHARLHGEEPAV